MDVGGGPGGLLPVHIQVRDGQDGVDDDGLEVHLILVKDQEVSFKCISRYVMLKMMVKMVLMMRKMMV